MEILGPACEAGECPHWNAAARTWLWVDNVRGTVFTSDGRSVKAVDASAVCAVPRRSGGLLIVTASDAAGFAAPADTRFNDGKCDGLGRLWLTTMSLTGAGGRAGLFRLDAGGLTPVIAGLDIGNGIGWSPDYRAMYVTDTGRRTIYRYPFDLAAGTLGRTAVLHRFVPRDGKPDGLAVAADGSVWSAMWDGACLIRLSPAGEIVERLAMPLPRPTSLAFGAGSMLVTSARKGLSEARVRAAPLSGHTLLFPEAAAGMTVEAFDDTSYCR